jgi:rubrerythrin
MYRQATIRCQKAKQWEKAREWAQRGLDVYGDEAARPEAFEDLHHRVDYAEAKLAQHVRPQRRQPTVVAAGHLTPAGGGIRIETLTCAECGQSFDRLVAKGREPRRCPSCASSAPPSMETSPS